MKQGPLLIDTSRKRKPAPMAVPKLLVALEPWHKIFLRNLGDLLWRRGKPPLQLVSRPADFWRDVFVPTRMPWTQFLQSMLGHICVIAALWGWSLLWPQRPRLVQPAAFHSSDVVYYDASEYLAPIDTGGAHARLPRKGEPAHAAQPIISVPPEADNRAQTIVAPTNVRLDQDVALPNVVALGRPTPTIPTAAMAASPSDLKLPVLPASVVAPAPEVNSTISRRDMQAPQPAVVGPAPEVVDAASRRVTDINIGHSQVVAPAPQLPVGAQRALSNLPMGNSGGAVVPPPPSMQGSGASNNGRLIALNLHPAAPSGPINVPAGSRRGTFAATPEGKPGAAGTPDIQREGQPVSGSGDRAGSSSGTNGVPSGLYVGTNPKSGNPSAVAGGNQGVAKAKSGGGSLIASAAPPRVAATPRASEILANAPTELERKVFGDRRSYAMILNVPNLNSAGGSWVMHFAELKDAEKPGELVYPAATQQVDPGYPLELMKQNVQGTVILSAVIRGDGSVGEVRILRGIDDRLDVYASAALARWRFRPAMRNGDPVALQTVVMIPFRPVRKPGF
jgi:TonB family protein